ncbi:hypothetical protein SEA_YABOI_273 [Streptomyces phage Yaboi]|uniref:Uncharacterized protein n=3 Tax=Streptomyces virus Yaboi TaxID=2846408 RepID=A0A385UIP7_9CAUD|nr:hypothetical protein HWB86_gp012 [Streptomyces phage Yaboi]YP_009841364.1 hypothetical protein HWB86_gp054 [Streptomyces phage Yaboi]UVD39860.1 hypothetical protein SEA_STANIMAL_12 [Streptomyces phage Stanimal]AYB70851.1 hypothetical protein SEA_YABOI_12 [Streptomyces phage Yaboi]AYB71065.1 hypothetical protein SEA_YABOI_273 [Streptomyces phage Yaboi]UVD40072.1 hypothetical protein SEA_STANIMAL_267 [Streptomyces phage Stanimal]
MVPMAVTLAKITDEQDDTYGADAHLDDMEILVDCE